MSDLRCPACGFPYGPGDWRTTRDAFSCIACHVESNGPDVVRANRAARGIRIPAFAPTAPARVRIAAELAWRAVRVLLKRP